MIEQQKRLSAVASVLTHTRLVVSLNPIKARVVSLSKKLYSHCVELVGFWNEFGRDFTIELNR